VPYLTRIHRTLQLNGLLSFSGGLNSNSGREVDCPETLHGCPQSLQANAPIVPLPYTFFPISYSLTSLRFDASLHKDVWRSVNIAPSSTSHLHAPSALQLWKSHWYSWYDLDETQKQPPCPTGDLTLVMRPQASNLDWASSVFKASWNRNWWLRQRACWFAN
jgi:hypothetical protein